MRIEAILRAAANPDSQRVDVVVQSLRQRRRRIAEATAGQLSALQGRVMSRSAAELTEIPDDEWQRLVDEANEDV